MPQEPSQQPRRRRQHKRSRNGCYTCKQRHIRCDEQTPICTNCLVRGGACGYPNGDSSAPDSNGEASGNSSETPAGPLTDGDKVDPQTESWHGLDCDFDFDFDFEADYDGTPYHSDFHGYFAVPTILSEHLLTRCLVPKSPDTNMQLECDRGNLLLASMHYAWVHGALGDTEQAYLYHKGEAIRQINMYLHMSDTDPAASDACTHLMAALALAEMGIGDAEAAHAHLNGLATLIQCQSQWQSPDEWQEQLNSLFDNIIVGFVEYLQTAWQ